MHIALRLLVSWRLPGLNHFQNPLFIDAGVAAVTRKQWHSHARNARKQNLVDGFLKHIQTGNTHNRIDITADDNLQNNRRSFRNEDLVSHLFGYRSEIGDTARSTFLAVHSKFVIVGRATFGMLQAVRQQEQSTAGIGRCNLIAPKGTAEHHHYPTNITFAQLLAFKQLAATVSISSLLSGRDLSNWAATSAQRVFKCSRQLSSLRHQLQVARFSPARLTRARNFCARNFCARSSRCGNTHRWPIIVSCFKLI